MHSVAPLRSLPWPEPPCKQTRVFHVAVASHGIERNSEIQSTIVSIPSAPPSPGSDEEQDANENLVGFSQKTSACQQKSSGIIENHFILSTSGETCYSLVLALAAHGDAAETTNAVASTLSTPQRSVQGFCETAWLTSMHVEEYSGNWVVVSENNTSYLSPCRSRQVSGISGPSNCRAHLLGSAVGFAMCDVHITTCEFK